MSQAVNADSKKPIESKDLLQKRSSLKKSDTIEKNTLPTVQDIYSEMLPDNLEVRKELSDLKNFITSKLKHIHINEKNSLPDADAILAEKTGTFAEVKGFDQGSLRHVEVREQTSLPSNADIKAEMLPDQLPSVVELEQLQQHIKLYLKHVDTIEKNNVPTSEQILEEGKNTFAEVSKFSKNNLKHVVMKEYSVLPEVADIWLEMLPDNLPTKVEVDALKKFANKDLKKVKTVVKEFLPTAEMIQSEKSSTVAEIQNFNKHMLTKVNTIEKNTLPNANTLREELLPSYLPEKPELAAIENFIKNSLKKVN